MKECEGSPELKDAMLQSLLDEDVRIRASSQMPAGFAGFYELIGIVSHMVGMEREACWIRATRSREVITWDG